MFPENGNESFLRLPQVLEIIGGADDVRREVHIGLDDHLLPWSDKGGHATEHFHGRSGRSRRAALDHGNVGAGVEAGRGQKAGRKACKGDCADGERGGLKFEEIASAHG